MCMWTRFGTYINRYAHMLMQIIVHTSSVYTSALHKRFYVIDLVYTYMDLHEWNKKCAISTTYMVHACLIKFKLSCTVAMYMHLLYEHLIIHILNHLV